MSSRDPFVWQTFPEETQQKLQLWERVNVEPSVVAEQLFSAAAHVSHLDCACIYFSVEPFPYWSETTSFFQFALGAELPSGSQIVAQPGALFPPSLHIFSDSIC